MQHIYSFSGGKDSTAMLFKALQSKAPIDRIIFVDTTKEYPEMYAHIERVKRMIPLPLETFEIPFDYYFSEHVKTKGKRKGEKGYGWPTMRTRWCTALKRQTFLKVVGKNVVEYHGIAADEAHRVKRNAGGRDIRYPLVEQGVTENDALQYCYSLGFSWGGLYEIFSRVSCYCCPLKRMGELLKTKEFKPEIWRGIEAMDLLQTRLFKAAYTFKNMDEHFSREIQKRVVSLKKDNTLF